MKNQMINSVLLLIVLLFNPVILGLGVESGVELDQDNGWIIDQDDDAVIYDEVIDVPSDMELEPIQFQTVHPKRSLLTSLEDADRLSEWTPINNTIAANETQYYEFVVNTTQTGLGAYYEILIFISGNICQMPDDLDDKISKANQLQVYYTFNQSDMYNLSAVSDASFQDGYMQALASNPTADPYSNLYIAVKSPDIDYELTGTWSYEMGISQNDLVFQWDDRSWAELVDSDDHSALFVTGNLSSQYHSSLLGSQTSNENNIYKLHIYGADFKHYFHGLNRSWCAINNGPELIPSNVINTELTTQFGNLKQQFYVTGLNSSSSYIGYLTQDYSGTEYGGTIFQQFTFETLDEGACELIFGLSFCENIAYSVPVSTSFLDTTNETAYGNKNLLLSLYDNHTEELYLNFAKAIQVVACDDELDSRYSPIRTCNNCISSYKNWLCSVTIPRCSTRNVTGYKYRDVDDNRNDFINDVIVPPNPYYEILPCIDVCHSIVVDCPSDFGFACPTGNESIVRSYYWDEDSLDGYPRCNDFSSAVTSQVRATEVLITVSGGSLLEVNYKLLISLILLNGVILIYI